MKIRLTDDTVIVASPDQVSADAAAEVTILHLCSGMYYGLDAVGASVWELIRTPKTVSEIVAWVVREYDVDADKCRVDILSLIDRLSDEKLIEIRHAATA